MTVSIIIVQSGIFGSAHHATSDLEKMGLRQSKDFVTASHPEDVDWAFSKSERQLFIVGTSHGREEPVVHFVNKAKEKNPNLVVWFYSTMPCKYPETYDRVISGLDRPSIPEVVSSYLSPSN